MPWVGAECADPRLPALAGEWLVGCSGREADRAWNLRTREQVELRHAVERVALGPGVVYGKPGLWRLDAGGALQHEGVLPAHRFDQLATDGQRVAMTTPEALVVGELLDNRLHRLEPAPAPWYRPAVAGERVAWVVAGEDLWWADGDGEPALLAGGEAPQRHVALSGTHAAWIEGDEVVLMSLADGERRVLPSDAHTARGLSLDGEVVCWEQWSGVDVDVRCSDGVRVERPGHQRNPSRSGRWLSLVEDGQVLVLELDAPPESEHP